MACLGLSDAEAVGLEPTSGATRRLFSRQAPHPAGWLPSSISSGGRNRTSGLLGQSQASLPAATAPDRVEVTRPGHLRKSAGSGRRTRTSTVRFKAGWPTINRSPRVPCGSRTRLSGLGSRCLDRSAKGTRRKATRRKEGESNPQGSSLGRFRDGCHRPLVRPSTISSGGRNRTRVLPVNSRAPVPARAPPESSSRGGRTRTGALLLPKQADCRAFPRPESSKCPAGVEPALPPWQGGRLPLHHGHKEPTPNCQRRAPGGTRTHAAALRVRCPRRWTTGAREPSEWDPRGSNPHLPG